MAVPRLRFFLVLVLAALLSPELFLFSLPVSGGSLSTIALLFPGVGDVVIAAGFPVAGLIALDEANPCQPIGALPEVTIGDQRANRCAVLTLERMTVEAVGDEHVGLERFVQRDVGGVAVMRFEDDEVRALLEAGALGERFDLHALPQA